jgi:hypothetical protein
MAFIVHIESSVSQLSASTVKAAHEALFANSEGSYAAMMSIMNGYSEYINQDIVVVVRIVDGREDIGKTLKPVADLCGSNRTAMIAALDAEQRSELDWAPDDKYARTTPYDTDTPGTKFSIVISLQFLQEMAYVDTLGQKHDYTLSRALAHEMAHVYQHLNFLHNPSSSNAYYIAAPDKAIEPENDFAITPEQRVAMEGNAHLQENNAMTGWEDEKACYESVTKRDNPGSVKYRDASGTEQTVPGSAEKLGTNGTNPNPKHSESGQPPIFGPAYS